jgi:cation diffusion facilitator CzcD-associated flavoprotein CzcO
MCLTNATLRPDRSENVTENRAVWNLALDDGGALQARAVVCALGQLGRPALPDIAGRDGFAGPWWHSGRWNHDADLAGQHPRRGRDHLRQAWQDGPQAYLGITVSGFPNFFMLYGPCSAVVTM